MSRIKNLKVLNKILHITIGLNVILWIVVLFEERSSNSVTSFGLFVGLFVIPISILIIIITLIIKLIVYTKKKHEEINLMKK